MNKEIFYSRNTQKILAFLCDYAHDSFYSNQIAEKVNLSKGGVSQTLRLLAKEHLLTLEKKGKMIFYQVDASSAVIKQFNVFRTIKLIDPLIRKLQLITDKVILFGSCAQGTNIKESDVDVLVVSRQVADVNTLFMKFKHKQKIQFILKLPQEYVVLEKKESVFFAEIEEGIVLWQRV